MRRRIAFSGGRKACHRKSVARYRHIPMPAPRFKIGQQVIYHGKRKAGRYVVLIIIPQRLGRFPLPD
jgi:hypothetical protein